MSDSSLGTATATFDLNITKFLSQADRAEEAMRTLDSNAGGMFGSGNMAALEFSDRLGEVAERVMNIGDRMYNSVTRPIMGFAAGAYMEASSLEQAFGKVSSVFKKNEADIITWSQNSAEAFGLSQTEALATVSTYGAIFQAMGLTEDASATYGKELIQLSADMAAFNDVSTDRTALALRSALTGEYESMKTFGIVLKADAVEAEALKIATQDLRTEVTEADRVQARYNLIMEQTSLQHGQWEQESKGAAGSLAILRAKWQDLKGTIGNIFLPVATRVTQVLITLVEILDRLPAPVKTAIVVVAGLAAAIGPLLIVLGFVLSSFASAIPLIIQFGPHVAKLIPTITNLSRAFTVLRTAMMALATANPILLAITALVVALGVAYKTNFLGFGDFIDDAISGLKKFTDLLFGIPENKGIGVTLDTSLTGEEDAWSNWTKMPDGTWKHATLNITTVAQDGRVEEIMDPATGEKSWLLHIDVDGDGIDDATKIIDSVDQGGGKFVMTIEINGRKYEAWYDEVTGETILLPMEMELTNEGEVTDRVNRWALRGAMFRIIFEASGFGFVVDMVVKFQEAIQWAIDLWNAAPWNRDDGEQPIRTKRVPELGEGATQYPASYGRGQAYQPPPDPLAGAKNSFGSSVGSDLRSIASEALAAASNIGNLTARTDELTISSRQAHPMLNATASTIPMIGRSSDTAASQVKGAGSAISGTFADIATTAASRSAEAQTSVSSNFGLLSTTAAGHMVGLQTKSALQFALMSSSASTSGAQMNTGLTGWMAGAQTKTVVQMALMVSTVRNAAGSGYDAGYYAGSQISLGFANGMGAYLGSIRSAASAMVSAASAAVIAKAMISSPSRLFMRYGQYMGEGLELGILGTLQDVASASERLINTSEISSHPLNYASTGNPPSGQSVVYIDNSKYVALSTSDLNKLLASGVRADAVHDKMSDVNGLAGFSGEYI